jgi:hypothetical protein
VARAAVTGPVAARELTLASALVTKLAVILPFLPMRETGAASDATITSGIGFVNQMTNQPQAF